MQVMPSTVTAQEGFVQKYIEVLLIKLAGLSSPSYSDHKSNYVEIKALQSCPSISLPFICIAQNPR